MVDEGLGIFFFSTHTLLVLPLLWNWLSQLERNVAPFTSISSWASQISGSTSYMRTDRRFYDAFIALLIQVECCVCNLLLVAAQTDFCFDFLSNLGDEGRRVSQITFPFFCIICGYFPAVVYVDGNRKATYSSRNLDFSASLF